MADIPPVIQPLPGPSDQVRDLHKGDEDKHDGLRTFVSDIMGGPGPGTTPTDSNLKDIVPNSSSVELTRAQADGLGYRNQDIARNEIFARHNYFFTREDLRDRFIAQGYEPNPQFNPVLNPRFDWDSMGMNQTEIKNVETLAAAQDCVKPAVLAAKMKEIDAVPKTDDTRLVGHEPLDPDHMARLKPDQLRYMRNEIAAGGGFYNWEDPVNQAAFANKTWYTPGKDTRSPDEIKVDSSNTRMLFNLEMRKRYPDKFQS